MIITLTNAEIKLKDSLTWGEFEQIQDSLGDAKFSGGGIKEGLSMKDMREMQYKILELSVIELKVAGQVIPYSKEWVKGLEVDEAINLLQKATELLDSKKK